jgi:hypothetical protein
MAPLPHTKEMSEQKERPATGVAGLGIGSGYHQASQPSFPGQLATPIAATSRGRTKIKGQLKTLRQTKVVNKTY